MSQNKMVKKLKLYLLSFVLILAPLFSSAQILPPNKAEPVPVPIFPFLGGPAGALTATGLIISIINIALAIAGLVAVVFLIIGGFRYVTAAGNEEQAEAAKKTLTHAVIGIVIIVLSFVLIRVITNALIGGPALT